MEAYDFHPICECVPDMAPAEFTLLVEDIRRTGRIREPLVVIGHQILDGRHRYKAHLETGVAFTTREFDPAADGDPVDFVRSRTMHRSLSASQRALMSMRLNAFTEEKALAQERKKQGNRLGADIANGKRSRAERRASEPDINAGRAIEKIAQQTGASPRMIQRAQKLLVKGHPDLVKAVDSGQLTLTEVETYLDLPQTDQARIAADPDRHARHAKAVVASGRQAAKGRPKEPVVSARSFADIFLGQLEMVSMRLAYECGARTPEAILDAFEKIDFDSNNLGQRFGTMLPLLDTLAEIATRVPPPVRQGNYDMTPPDIQPVSH
ncbi:hypothetical protein [Burkholderia diffusa]|uniref:hypothetical protein n=1 Tax=Burkholderia diffusa TaxID=488732 RepID=UPI00075301D3|nr:hypothetical protein [Burkholderia diffusa]KVH51201.1 hypothetical protein WJ39_08600 [Burkholderia diffusa]